MTVEHLAGARDAIASTFGVLPGCLNPQTTGPLVREAQRHLAQFVLQPIAEIVAQEASEKLGAKVALDLVSPLQAFDQGGPAPVRDDDRRSRQRQGGGSVARSDQSGVSVHR